MEGANTDVRRRAIATGSIRNGLIPVVGKGLTEEKGGENVGQTPEDHNGDCNLEYQFGTADGEHAIEELKE